MGDPQRGAWQFTNKCCLSSISALHHYPRDRLSFQSERKTFRSRDMISYFSIIFFSIKITHCFWSNKKLNQLDRDFDTHTHSSRKMDINWCTLTIWIDPYNIKYMANTWHKWFLVLEIGIHILSALKFPPLFMEPLFQCDTMYHSPAILPAQCWVDRSRVFRSQIRWFWSISLEIQVYEKNQHASNQVKLWMVWGQYNRHHIFPSLLFVWSRCPQSMVTMTSLPVSVPSTTAPVFIHRPKWHKRMHLWWCGWDHKG